MLILAIQSNSKILVHTLEADSSIQNNKKNPYKNVSAIEYKFLTWKFTPYHQNFGFCLSVPKQFLYPAEFPDDETIFSF